MITSTDHHGIPLHTIDQSMFPANGTTNDICTGTLIFSVGTQDEPLELLGITHLVEHMILGVLEHFPLPHGAVVDHESIQFHAAGHRADVAAYFEALAHTISNFAQLTKHDLTLAKLIIKAENPAAYTEFTSGMLSYRFGARGPGLVHLHSPTLEAITLDEVISWVTTWFTAGQAALSFTSQAPTQLNVQLPSGARHTRPVITCARQNPTLIASPLLGVALSLLVPSTYAALLADALEYELVQSLRTSDGLIYSVEQLIYQLPNSTLAAASRQHTGTSTDSEFGAANESLYQVDLILDPLPENTVPVLKRSVLELRRIAEQGFSTDAVIFARTVLANNLAFDEPFAASYLDQYTSDFVAGRSTPERATLISKFIDYSVNELANELSDVLVHVLTSLLVAHDDDFKVSAKKAAMLGLEREKFSTWQRSSTQRKGSVTVFNLEGADDTASWVHRSAKEKLTLTDTHLLKKKPSKTLFIELATIRLVGVRVCGCLCLIDDLGRHTEIDTAEFKRSKSLRAALLGRFEKRIIRNFPEL